MFELILKQIKTGYNLAVMNWNFTKIKEVCEERVLHRKEGHNVMQQDLDMNGYSILNADIDYGPFEERLGILDDKVGEVEVDLQDTKEDLSIYFSAANSFMEQSVEKNNEQDGRLDVLEAAEAPIATEEEFGLTVLASDSDVSYPHGSPYARQGAVVTVGTMRADNKWTSATVSPTTGDVGKYVLTFNGSNKYYTANLPSDCIEVSLNFGVEPIPRTVLCRIQTTATEPYFVHDTYNYRPDGVEREAVKNNSLLFITFAPGGVRFITTAHNMSNTVI